MTFEFDFTSEAVCAAIDELPAHNLVAHALQSRLKAYREQGMCVCAKCGVSVMPRFACITRINGVLMPTCSTECMSAFRSALIAKCAETHIFCIQVGDEFVVGDVNSAQKPTAQKQSVPKTPTVHKPATPKSQRVDVRKERDEELRKILRESHGYKCFRCECTSDLQETKHGLYACKQHA